MYLFLAGVKIYLAKSVSQNSLIGAIVKYSTKKGNISHFLKLFLQILLTQDVGEGEEVSAASGPVKSTLCLISLITFRTILACRAR